jgi:hypothetical protein
VGREKSTDERQARKIHDMGDGATCDQHQAERDQRGYPEPPSLGANGMRQTIVDALELHRRKSTQLSGSAEELQGFTFDIGRVRMMIEGHGNLLWLRLFMNS